MTVHWRPTARIAAEAVPCPTCHAAIGVACDGAVHPVPHRERAVRADAFGFRDVPAAPLLERVA